MSLELKNRLNMVAEENKAREMKEFEEGFERYRSLLIRVAKVPAF